MESYRLLQEQLQLKYELPVTPDWSAAADFLFLIKEHCLRARPGTIVECSSGLTTLTLARCCQLNNHGQVFSLENGEIYAEQTRNNLIRFELGDYARVIHAPLEETLINNDHYQWYRTDELPELSIDMLVIDGPPGFIQKHSRFPALPVLFDRLADQAIVFMDDAARQQEKEIIAMWLAMNSHLEHEYIDTDRGCSILMIHK